MQLFTNEKLKNWAMKDYNVVIQDPEDEKRNKYFIDVWLTDPNQKTYSKIVFDPTLTDSKLIAPELQVLITWHQQNTTTMSGMDLLA
jgi:hypothetical protein